MIYKKRASYLQMLESVSDPVHLLPAEETENHCLVMMNEASFDLQ